MHDPRLIWRLGRWIARRENGAIRLAWSDGEVVLRVHRGRIHSVDGVDSTQVAHRLDLEPAGHHDLLEEARLLSRQRGIPETQALGTAKEVLLAAIQAWILDPGRELELVEGEPDEANGPTISLTHALVELVLSSPGREVVDRILPDRSVLLRRAPSFLNLYAPLRLSEDADLIVARITGQRTAHEIAEQSEHGPEEVTRLLAALVTTGMLEASEAPARTQAVVLPDAAELDAGETELESADAGLDEPRRRRLPLPAVVAAVVLVVALLSVAAWWWNRSPAQEAAEPVVTEGSDWGLVVDMGCEPEDLQRMYKARSAHSGEVEVITTSSTGDEDCWRLVWGRFPTQQAAEEATGAVPDPLRRPGFESHVIELGPAAAGPAPE